MPPSTLTPQKCVGVGARAPAHSRASFWHKLPGANRSLPGLAAPPQLCSHVRLRRPEPPHTALPICPWHPAPCQASASSGHSPGHLWVRRAKFPGLGDSYFPSPGAFGVPRAWCPPHRLSSMVPWTRSRLSRGACPSPQGSAPLSWAAATGSAL